MSSSSFLSVFGALRKTKMNLNPNFDSLVPKWEKMCFWSKVVISVLTIIPLPQSANAVVNGRMKDRGLYVIQSVVEPRYVLGVGDDSLAKTSVAGEDLNQVVTSKWRNEEEQKWTVKLFGKKYYFLTSAEKKQNNVTYKVYTEDFPIPNIWEIHGVQEGKHWMIKLNRGKCISFAGLESPVRLEKCDKKNEFQLWNFHLLNQ